MIAPPSLQLLEIYLYHFTNALQGEQYVDMKRAFEQERDERERNFGTLTSTLDQTHESMENLRGELVTMRESLQSLEASLESRLGNLQENIEQSIRDHQGKPDEVQSAVAAAVDSGVKDISKLLELGAEEQVRLGGVLMELGGQLARGFEQLNQKLDSKVMIS